MKTKICVPGIVVIALGMGLAFGQADTGPTIYHVSSKGDDRNSGALEKPFATLERARDAVRALKKAPLTKPVQVLIGEGTYCLSSPFVLKPEDSGTAECPITYEAQTGARVVISGGRAISGWRDAKVDGKYLWVADVPDVAAGKWNFRELWVNGRRAVRARHPKQGFLKVAGLPDVKKDTPWDKGQNRFQFHPGDIKNYANLADVDVVAMHLWMSVRLPVASVDEKEHLVTFAHKSHFRLTDGSDPARYYMENAFEFLDTPGEWYLDRKTGKVYYWPREEDFTGYGNPKSIALLFGTAPVLPGLVRFEGQPKDGKLVEHVRLRGLSFQHTEWWPGKDDPVDAQAAVHVPAVVQGEGMRHCTIENCTVAHASNYGIHLSYGCQENRIVGCELFDLGAGGIKIGDTEQAEPVRQTHHNMVTDNHIHDCGQIFHHAVGVFVGQSYANQIAHNHIHDLYYTGLSCGWTWGYGKTLARDNIFEFNHVHDLGKAWLSDMGGIYTLGMQPGTVIRSNVFHDINGFNYGGWGIYFDEGSTHILAENNLVYRTSHGGFHQHYGKENIVRNNIFALSRDAQIRRTRQEPHLSFTFERNIVYWQEGTLLDGSFDKGNVAFDKNLYWHAKKGPIRFGRLTLAEWQAKGMDAKSVIADPLFASPEKNDFTLAAQSPASRVGFVPLDLATVGPRKGDRATK